MKKNVFASLDNCIGIGSGTWLLKYLKGPLSENASAENLLKGPKHCWNLQNITCTLLLDQPER